jgi:type I restriction enzyme S subunit
MDNIIPEGWIWTNIQHVADLNMGQSPPSSTYNEEGIGLPFFQGKAEFGKVYPTVRKYCSDPVKIADPNDILISVRAPVGPTNLCEVTSCIGRGLAAIKANSATSTDFLLFFFKKIEPWLSSQGSGSTFTAINKDILNDIAFPLPPLAEQHRILTKLNAAMQRVEVSQARLEKLPGLLKRFRQAVLTAAVSGRLTETWRAEQLELRAAADALEALQLSRVSQARTLKAKSELAEIFNIAEQGNHFELPDTWQFVALDKLATSFNYGTSAKSENAGEVPVLRMGNLQGGKIDWSDLKYTSSKKEIEQYTLTAGDVLFNRTNSPELVGKTSIYRGEQPAIFAGYLIRIKTAPELNPEYLNYCLNSSYARQYCWDVKTDGVSQSNINAQKLSRFEVPFCSLEEQLEIVRQVNHYFELAVQLEARFEQAAATVEQLPQALLAKAFSGLLVPQDPNDEPAGVLLERIKFATNILPAKATRKTRTIATDATGTKQTRSNMKAKPVKTLPEFVERLTQLGGKAEPKQLLIEFDLQNDVDSFFELLRDGKSQGILNVPMGKDGLVELV